MSERPLVIACAGEQLVAVLHSPDRIVATTAVIIVAGGPQYRVGSHRQFVLLGRSLAAAGVACLRFDYRGMGDSSGSDIGFESIERDIRCAIDCLLIEHRELTHVCLWGLCDAASAILIYSWQDPRVDRIAILNPWIRSSESEARAVIDHYYRRRFFSRDFWMKLFGGGVDLSGVAREFRRNWRAARSRPTDGFESGSFRERMQLGLERLRVPVLLITSGDDLTAAEFLEHVAASRRWRDALSRPGNRREHLVEANHTFSRHHWRKQVEEWTLSWVQVDAGAP